MIPFSEVACLKATAQIWWSSPIHHEINWLRRPFNKKIINDFQEPVNKLYMIYVDSRSLALEHIPQADTQKPENT